MKIKRFLSKSESLNDGQSRVLGGLSNAFPTCAATDTVPTTLLF
jgi:hypothetical protein